MGRFEKPIAWRSSKCMLLLARGGAEIAKGSLAEFVVYAFFGSRRLGDRKGFVVLPLAFSMGTFQVPH
jgi:hypothetical protein